MGKTVFKIEANPTFPATVKIPRPGGDIAELQLIFKHNHTDDLPSLIKKGTKTSGSDSQADFLIADIVAGWPEGAVANADGSLEFSKENLTLILNGNPGAGGAIFDQYLAALGGARLGN